MYQFCDVAVSQVLLEPPDQRRLPGEPRNGERHGRPRGDVEGVVLPAAGIAGHGQITRRVGGHAAARKERVGADVQRRQQVDVIAAALAQVRAAGKRDRVARIVVDRRGSQRQAAADGHRAVGAGQGKRGAGHVQVAVDVDAQRRGAARGEHAAGETVARRAVGRDVPHAAGADGKAAAADRARGPRASVPAVIVVRPE